jgi:hypothetical protein
MLGTDDEQHYWDCHEAAAEIERLRLALARLADQDATFSIIGGNMIVDVDNTLTDAEREALIVASIELQALSMSETNYSDAIRGLLARTGQTTGHAPVSQDAIA